MINNRCLKYLVIHVNIAFLIPGIMFFLIPFWYAYFLSGVLFSVIWLSGLYVIFKKGGESMVVEGGWKFFLDISVIVWSSVFVFVFIMTPPSGWIAISALYFGLYKLFPSRMRYKGILMRRR